MGHGGPRGFRVWDNREQKYGEKDYVLSTTGAVYEKSVPHGVLAEIVVLWLDEENRYSVEMATGFKDENGKPVYAGDIVGVPAMLGEPVNDAWSSMVGVVKFVNCAWVVGTKRGCTRLRADDKIQLIGNIHQLDKLPTKYRNLISKAAY